MWSHAKTGSDSYSATSGTIMIPIMLRCWSSTHHNALPQAQLLWCHLLPFPVPALLASFQLFGRTGILCHGL